jgi:hypothetical protein
MRAIHTLLRGCIDYAGLFPPAALDMATSVDNYSRYLAGPCAWALGRFIVPAARLGEFAAVARAQLAAPHTESWRLAALVGPEVGADIDLITDFNRRYGSESGFPPRVLIDTVELKVASRSAIQSTMAQVPPNLQAYLEIPIEEDPAELILAIREFGARAKVRTGGTTLEAFPAEEHLGRFIQRCIAARVPFKATAGLHHAVRAEYRLTYAPDSNTGTMFGFLNLLLATGFIRGGLRPAQAEQVLNETSLRGFDFRDDQIVWNGHSLGLDDLAETRSVMISFGSCSFTEPLEDLVALQLLEPRTQPA